MKIEITIEELLDSYDWEEVFGEGPGGNCNGVIQVVPPGADISSDGVKRTDVTEIIAAVNGERDESDWVGVFLLKDGRYLVAEGGCDYTGWDCRASNSLCVCPSLTDAVNLGLNAEQRKGLGFP